MSLMKQFIENEIDRISEVSGYSREFLMDTFNEMMEDGSPELKQLEEVAMERDFCQFKICGTCTSCPANCRKYIQ